MRKFMDENFLLYNDTAAELYKHISELPIIDYHCHLEPRAIAENARFRNITELWLGGDHYKWRLMRHNGVPETHITGDAPDCEKFAAFCTTVQDLIGSPVFHWAHLELKNYFGFEGVITAENAPRIFEHCNKIIEREDFNVHGLLRQSRVEWLATTDEPIDSLEHHKRLQRLRRGNFGELSCEAPQRHERLRRGNFGELSCEASQRHENGLPTVLPTFRPDTVLKAGRDFPDYIKKLSAAAKIKIADWHDLLAALSARMDFFAQMGCKISDHSLEPPVFCRTTDNAAAQVFKRLLAGEEISTQEATAYKTRLFSWLGGEYHRRGWAMQLHMGVQRDNNSRMLRLAGANTGFDCIADDSFSQTLALILDDLESRDVLPRTILYALNPACDDMLAVMTGGFAGRGIRGRVQWGSAWWFNDSKTGIQKHLTTLASHGILANFIGMLTDSRSFLSYSRHEYFRRILAQQLGEWVERGEFPSDMARLKKIAEDIAYYNVRNYFRSSPSSILQ